MAESLQSRLDNYRDPIDMLRDSPSGPFKSPYPLVHSNWQEEQAAWLGSAVLFDQSHHMTDVYFRGPDVKRLLADTGTNSFAGYGRDRAKHFVACNDDGAMIGTAVLFGLEDEEVSLVGPAAAANWVQYQAESGGYDVEVVRDERTNDKGAPRLTYRYEIEGPSAGAIIEKLQGHAIEPIPFFRMTEFRFGEHQVRALSHTMAGTPGSEDMGFEIWGPVEEGAAVLDQILQAGEEFGLVRGGALAYYTGSIESGYAAQPTPAIYTGRDCERIVSGCLRTVTRPSSRLAGASRRTRWTITTSARSTSATVISSSSTTTSLVETRWSEQRVVRADARYGCAGIGRTFSPSMRAASTTEPAVRSSSRPRSAGTREFSGTTCNQAVAASESPRWRGTQSTSAIGCLWRSSTKVPPWRVESLNWCGAKREAERPSVQSRITGSAASARG